MLIVSGDGRGYKEILIQHSIEDTRLRFLPSDKHQSGPNATRNLALARTYDRFIAPLDADDLYDPQRLEILLPMQKIHGVSADKIVLVDDPSNTLFDTVFPE